STWASGRSCSMRRSQCSWRPGVAVSISNVVFMAVLRTLSVATCLEEGSLWEREEFYARLLVRLANAERGCCLVIERTSYLLGKSVDRCPDRGSTDKAIIRAHCGHGWQFGEQEPMATVTPRVLPGAG